MSELEADGVEAVVLEAFSRFRRRRPRSWQSAEEAMDEILCELRGELDEAMQHHSDFVTQVPSLITREVGSLIELTEAARVHQLLIHVVNASPGQKPPPDVQYVLTGLLIRAIATLSEIEVLLRNGFSYGARARWRTLYEIYVVSRVLALGNRSTATRYREHRWVMLARERKRTGETDWASQGPTPEAMEARLLRRFGRSFGGEYGWAVVVSKRKLSKATPQWPDLVTLAETDALRTRVHAAHHAVHGADALGLLGTVRSSVFHAGASPDGVLVTARDTINLFAQCSGSLLSLWRTYSPIKVSESAELLSQAILTEAQLALGYRVPASDPAERRAWEDAWASLLPSTT